MLDTRMLETPDQRPAIAICAYEIGETGWDPVEDLSGAAWSPTGARTLAIDPAEPEVLAVTLSEALASPACRGLLLVGRTRQEGGFKLQIRTENRSLDGTHRGDADGPGIARATAPTAEMVREMTDAGLKAGVSSEAEDDVGSYLLYRVLAALPEGVDTPAVGLLRAPVDAADERVQRAVKAAAQAMARHLAPLPRPRVA